MPTDEFLGLSPAGWAAVAAIATVGTFIIALIAVLFARRQLTLALDQFKEQQQAQIEAERPYVIVTIEPSRATMRIQDLVIRNIGHRPAFDTRIVMEPPPRHHTGSAWTAPFRGTHSHSAAPAHRAHPGTPRDLRQHRRPFEAD